MTPVRWDDMAMYEAHLNLHATSARALICHTLEHERGQTSDYHREQLFDELQIAVASLGFSLVPQAGCDRTDPDTIPAVTSAPGFDGRDNSIGMTAEAIGEDT